MLESELEGNNNVSRACWEFQRNEKIKAVFTNLGYSYKLQKPRRGCQRSRNILSSQQRCSDTSNWYHSLSRERDQAASFTCPVQLDYFEPGLSEQYYILHNIRGQKYLLHRAAPATTCSKPGSTSFCGPKLNVIPSLLQPTVQSLFIVLSTKSSYKYATTKKG